jgi:lysophospholipase L1-like esterase
MAKLSHLPGRPGKDRVPRGTFVTAAIAATLFSGALTLVAATGAAGATGTYVALGDSYTSGPDIPTQSTNPPGCLRSDHNYPSDAATALGLTLTDVSCSGATTADMSSPQTLATGPANPPQFSPLSSTTGVGVVSLQVGGDDLGFTSIIENCVALTPWGPTRVGANCKNYYDPHGNDSLKAAITVLQSKIAALIAQIHSLAPSAEVFVVGYPAILPQSGACWPSMPFETGDAQYLNQTEVELDNALEAAATSVNYATYVNTYTQSIPHNACASEANRWVEPLVPASPAYPVHPNANGEAAMALALEAAIKSAGL